MLTRVSMGSGPNAENRGVKALGFLVADAEVDMQVESLDFLDVYLRRFNGMEVDGRGTLKGRLHYDRGNLSQATDILVTASELGLNVDRYGVQGTGSIHVRAKRWARGSCSEPSTPSMAVGSRSCSPAPTFRSICGAPTAS